MSERIQLIMGRDDYTLHTADNSSGLSDEVYNELYNRFFNAAKNKVTDPVEISDLNITLENPDAVGVAIYDVVYGNPDLFYMRSSYRGEGSCAA